MADSSGATYPPSVTQEQSDFILSSIKDWSIFHGLAVRPSQSFVPKDVDDTASLATTAPLTMFPSLFPRSCFLEARQIQCAYNQLYAAVAKDEKWLNDVVQELMDVDDYIAQLWNVHLEVKREGYVQNLSLGIFRSDYMVHEGRSTSNAKPEMRQVEFNTIASSFGGLSTKVSALHKYLLSNSAYPSENRNLTDPSHLPDNPSIESISFGLQAAHKAYGASKSSPPLPLCIIFVVQPHESNIFDQLALSYHLQTHHNTPVFRLPFPSILTETTIPPSYPSRPLIYSPPHSPSTPYEVTTLYFRAGYSPSEYTSPESWAGRLHLERSAAIKCPSILTHLAGSKKVQQILATPSTSHVEQFLCGTGYEDMIARVRATFAAMYPLDNSPAGRKAISICRDVEQAKNYVLKPQREGGGNNVYGAKIPDFLASLGEDEARYRGHILMELIEPPSVRNTILRNGQVQSGEVIGELGVYGVCLWENAGGKGEEGGVEGKVLENREGGFLLRTKGRQSEEGGVAAGFGAVDSPRLV